MFRFFVIVLCIVASHALPRFGWAEIEEGRANIIPWSGYWWPQRTGEILRPLTKYDQLTGKHSASVERRQRPAKPDTPAWFGKCHAWAAASIFGARTENSDSGKAGP